MDEQKKDKMRVLREMYVFGSDVAAGIWRGMAEDPEWQALFRGLVWQNGNQRFVIAQDGLWLLNGNHRVVAAKDGLGVLKDGPQSLKGKADLTDEPVTLAHPAEMDAKEILLWETFLKEHKLRPPFRLLEEPVVVKDGLLAGTVCRVESGGKPYEMSERYKGFRLPLNMTITLQRQGFHFITRKKWVNHTCLDEIELVNIVTPAGVFYECRPTRKMKTLGNRKDLFLVMGLFYPFGNVRMRTLNHVAATIEKPMIEQFVQQDRPDLLLPHIRTMSNPEIEQLISTAPETRTAGLLSDVLAERRKGSC